ncbi:MAG: hypothetical protein EOQ86_20795 [Mesorhizobium sp.]|nr:MAG: hypothetical protein EOQ85_21355 [Mesorhizobium sp.]RWH79977.1 MAG: hypothetical protein EOQ86_20795 [Mesorhizobium sp.]RWH89133.1 MAG: hypothetical protein EOQ87_17730 [Mesorhizobium sp.]RWI01837.1 MAG: hypothetical protein EOQ88_05455 [Mesorhizobium sp.]RWI03401.1 MAG: hypothetical protein EOQ89_12345 [Mesorhizobium sp.]
MDGFDVLDGAGADENVVCRIGHDKWGAKAPPSVLPDISPSRGEIGSFAAVPNSLTLVIGETIRDIRSPPLKGRCQVVAKRAGQRGVGRNVSISNHRLRTLPYRRP